MFHIARKLVRKIIRLLHTREHEWFTGNYNSFAEARVACTGYDAPAILEKVKNALLKVKNGEAIYERDSVLFDHPTYSYPLVSSLLYVASASNNKLNIVDFGGSLGSTYFQNRTYLKYLKEIKWSIVEQRHFVECGKQNFQNAQLKFFESIEACRRSMKPNLLLLSSVLQYLPAAIREFEKLLEFDFEFVIIDRTPFLMDGSPDRLTIQHVPAEIYEAHYPAWFFNYESVVAMIRKRYEIIDEFPSLDTQTLPDAEVSYLGMLLERKNRG